jgi:Arc/MetJ-type ribon-helix-helix transcriptional regulator
MGWGMAAKKKPADVPLSIRLGRPLVERLDRYAERLKAERPGLTVSRADVVRVLLTKALDAEEGQEGRPERP